MADVLKGSELREQSERVPDWEVVDEHHLTRSYDFDDFKGALDFVNQLGELAEAENHHPEVSFGWGHAEVTFFSHDAGGITASDIEIAGKVDEL